MSLEDRIADLQEQAGLLLDLPQQMQTAALGHISDIADSYQDHLEKFETTFYVSATGDDNASGLDTDNPLQTINKAVSLTPSGGICNALLMSAITMLDDVKIEGKTLRLDSSSSIRHEITFERETVVANSFDFGRLRGFEMDNICEITFRNLTLNMPATDGPFANDRMNNLSSVITYGGSSQNGAFLRVAIVNCNINRPAGSDWPLVGPPGILLLYVSGVTETDQSMLGRWIAEEDDINGVDPQTLRRVVTNLSLI